MKRLFAAAIVCAALSGCGSGSTPAPTPAPAPTPVPPVALMPPRRGRWMPWASPVVAEPWYLDAVPPVCHGKNFWQFSNSPIPPGAVTADNGIVTLRSEVPGWSMITRDTYSRDAYCSLAWDARAKLTDPVIDAFFGIGFFDGEPDYRTINFLRGNTPGKLNLVLLTEPAHSLDALVPDFCDENTWHNFRMDMEAGVLSLYVDGVAIPCPQYGPLQNDPHVCIFIGGMGAQIAGMSLFSEQP